jgi:large subunit ribosomal protein L1
MGRPRIKVIDTAIDTEKAEKLEKKELELSKETEEKVKKEAKEAKKPVKKDTSSAKKAKKQKVRSNRYKSLLNGLDKSKDYPLSEAIDIIKKTANIKFDSSLEVHVNLNVDPTKSDQLIRKSINLPNNSGKTMRVLVFGGNSKILKNAGIDVGTDSTLERIGTGKIEAEKIVATPEWMPKLAKVAKVLGPKGLMPNPKSGTVTDNPDKLIKDLQGGMIEVKTEKSGIVHIIVGKVSLPNEKLEENVKTLISELRQSKPESLKKELIRSVYLSSTMGPSVRIDLSSFN